MVVSSGIQEQVIQVFSFHITSLNKLDQLDIMMSWEPEHAPFSELKPQNLFLFRMHAILVVGNVVSKTIEIWKEMRMLGIYLPKFPKM
jgi:hypothetical protein